MSHLRDDTRHCALRTLCSYHDPDDTRDLTSRAGVGHRQDNLAGCDGRGADRPGAQRAAFWRWSAHHDGELLGGSRVVTTARGDIEVAIIGAGRPVLQLHGSPGGYDQPLTRLKLQPERRKGVQTISVSRPGYLRTPLTSGRTHQEQADLYAALLDVLRLPCVVVQGASGASYSAMQFALRHPDRTTALILYAPDMGGHTGGSRFEGSPLEDYGRWLVTSGILFPFVGPLLARDFDATHDVERDALRSGIRSTIPTRWHRAGRHNDIGQRETAEIERWPLEDIAVPTLVVHGTKDENTSYERSVRMAARIPGARLVSIDGADHLMAFTRPGEVTRVIDEFIAALPAH